MNKRMPGLALLVLLGLTAFAACTIKNAEEAQPASSGGGGGASAAGASHGAGRGGTGNHAGSAGKSGAGAAGKATAGKPGAGEGPDEGGAGGDSSTEPPQCANKACTSGLCFVDGTCVDCLPAFDNCPSGQVCGSTNTCVPGCKEDGTSCASGVCATAKDCKKCLSDDECGGGNVCGDNQCAPTCTALQEGTSAGCGTGHTCCSLHCIDSNTDSAHCGACGAACAAGQFCGPAECSESGAAGAGGASDQSSGCVACHDTTLANLCSFPQVAVVLDGADGNESTGRALAAALAAQCSPSPVVREVSQTIPDALNPASGRPVSGAHELLVSTGGSFFARLLVYLDSKKVSPIYSHIAEDGNVEFRKSSNDETVALRASDSDVHDFFVIQFVREPTSGSLVLNAQGFWFSGTLAATYFFEHGMLPALSTFDKSWYVYEWTDSDGDKAPDLNEITPVAAGN